MTAPAFARTSPFMRRKSLILTIVMSLFILYTLLPLFWLLINATKEQGDLFTTFAVVRQRVPPVGQHRGDLHLP